MRPRRVLVPIVGGDITEATLALARAALDHPGASLALVHVMRPRQLAHPPSHEPAVAHGGDVPRWHLLAASVPPGRVFVDAVVGEPAAVILSQARRFASDLIVLGHPGPAAAHAPSSDRVIAQVLRAAPGRVLVATDHDVSGARTATADRSTARARMRPRPTRRYHADRPRTPHPVVPPRCERRVVG